MTITGHHTIQTFFGNAIANNSLSHAYCFAGPASVGKYSFAVSIAETLLKTEKILSHPDFLYITQEINQKTGKTKKHIDVDQVHQVTSFFSRFAAMHGYRVAIIDGAEKMNEHASNALLKTLEELPETSIIFLITSNKESLPATILSRCQTFDFERLPAADMTAIAASLGISDQDMIRHAAGRPGLLAIWQNDPDMYVTHKETVTAFISLFGQPLYKKLAVVEPLFGDKKDHIATRETIVDTLATWMVLVRDIYQHAQGNKALLIHKDVQALTLTRENMIELIRKIATAQYRLRQNIHPRLLIEDIVLSIP